MRDTLAFWLPLGIKVYDRSEPVLARRLNRDVCAWRLGKRATNPRSDEQLRDLSKHFLSFEWEEGVAEYRANMIREELARAR